MTDNEFREKLRMMTVFDNPAFMLFNDKHTIMVNSSGETRALAYSKSLNEEVFVPCDISVERKSFELIDRENIILAKGIPAYKENKSMHRGLGLKMISI